MVGFFYCNLRNSNSVYYVNFSHNKYIYLYACNS